MNFKKTIKNTIKTSDLNGFTKPLAGALQNYIVAFTDNDQFNIDNLNSQFENWDHKENLTVGGRRDSKTNKLFIDLGFSVSSLREAMLLGKCYNQKAIRDNVNMQEIRLIN